MFFTSPITASFISVFFLSISAIYDLCCRRVPNYLTGAAVIVGLIFPWIAVDSISVLSSYLGGLLGLLLFLPPYVGGLMGAGDVKVFGVSGLFVGVNEIFTLSLYVAIAGGFLALLYLLKRIVSRYLGDDEVDISATPRLELPYVVAIFCGLLYMLITERLT